jgi:hypothetical protein
VTSFTFQLLYLEIALDSNRIGSLIGSESVGILWRRVKCPEVLVLRGVVLCSGVDIPTFRRTVVIVSSRVVTSSRTPQLSFEALVSVFQEDQNPQRQCCASYNFRT